MSQQSTKDQEGLFAVVNTVAKGNLERKRFISVHNPREQSIREERWGRKPESRN